MNGGAGGLGQLTGSHRGGKGTMGGRGAGDGYKQDGTATISGSEESVGGKRRRQGSSQSLSHVAPPPSAGGADSSNRSVGSEGSSSQAARNKKRFVWPDDLHRDFVAAIFDVGLKSASPKTILEMMSNSRDLTADHIKSHLQKYRLHRDRARDEFLGNFGRPQNTVSRDAPPVAGEVAVDLEQSRSLLPRPGNHGVPMGAADFGGGDQQFGGGGAEGGNVTAVTLIRDCLQMQAGFQQVLKQALASQQQLQAQLQTHMRALGLEPTMVDEVTGGGGAPRNRPGSGPQPAFAPPMAAGMANMMHARPGSAQAGAAWSGPRCDVAVHHPSMAEDLPVGPFGHPPRHPHAFHPDPLPPHADHHPPSQLPPLPPHPQPPHHPGGAAGGGGGGASAPPLVTPNMQRRCAEQQMQEEMREHMDMHRQLVQRKNMQVSQYDGSSLALSGAPANPLASIGAMHRPPPPAHHPPPQPQQHPPVQHPPVQHTGAHPPMAPSSGPSGASAGTLGSLLQGGHPDLVDMDLTGFQWNDDDDHLFNFLMDP